MSKEYGKPNFPCSDCGRTMELVTWLGEGMDKAAVECPVCATRETKTVDGDTPRQ